MAHPRIKWNRSVFRQIRTSAEVSAELKRRGEAIASAAGEDFEAQPVFIGKNRARVIVEPTTAGGMYAESRDAALTRAIDAGRS